MGLSPVGGSDRQAVVVVGCGYVGLSVAAGFAELGSTVLGVEVDENRLELLRTGRIPFHEPGLEDLVSASLETGGLSFTGDLRVAAAQGGIVFICVPTPSSGDGSADLSIVEGVIRVIREVLPPGSTVVLKSTVPVGASEVVSAWLERDDVEVVSNPEFLQAGRAVSGFRRPDRILIGAWSEEAGDLVARLFEGVDAPVIRMDPREAELVKYASNAYLALRLSFVNTVAEMCELGGGDAWRVMEGMGLDHRIGTGFLRPGPGWGGSCLPKDVRAMAAAGHAVGADMSLLDSADRLNQQRFTRVAEQVAEQFDGLLAGRRIAVWGLTFKAGTDDLRDSPALAVVRRLIEGGASVVAYDPMVQVLPLEGLSLRASPEEAVLDAECLVVLTEWPEFAGTSAPSNATALSRCHVIDARGVLDAAAWRAAGFEVATVGVGRSGRA